MKKEFDAVKSMQDIREKLNKEYSQDLELRNKRLKKIHKEYGIFKQGSGIQNVSDEMNTKSYKNKKSFDSVKFFREIKEKIAEETAGMTFEELNKYMSEQTNKAQVVKDKKSGYSKF